MTRIPGLGDLGFHVPEEALRLMSACADLLEGRTRIEITETLTPGWRVAIVKVEASDG